MAVTFTTVILHPLWCYLLIIVADLDIVGAAYAMGVTQFINLLIISIYIHYWTPNPESYFCFNKESISFNRICDYLKVSIYLILIFS
jgi:Na+-driven multidrug efflux pump